jgi:glycosyltransferase involved in cell wall biosynthesis
MKLAIVTPWFGRDVTGGAEQHAWQLATLLAGRGHDIEVLTTCCRSHQDDWETNHLKPGVTPVSEGFTVRRFEVEPRDRIQFDQVAAHLLSLPPETLTPGTSPVTDEQGEIFVNELIRSQSLVDYVDVHRASYDWFLLLPYLYGPVLHSIFRLGQRAVLQPCLHNEAYAYLPQVRRAFQLAGKIFFNSEGEKALALQIFGPDLTRKSHVVGEGIELEPAPRDLGAIEAIPPEIGKRFVLYLGRKAADKNVPLLSRSFLRFKLLRYNSSLKLVFAGPGRLETDIEDESVIDLGLVSEELKINLLERCLALCQPSKNESFSRVMMEAWLKGRPVAVHASCLATATAVERCGGGWLGETEDDWAKIFTEISRMSATELDALGKKGRDYALEIADWDKVIDRYEQILAVQTHRQVFSKNGARERPRVALVVQRCGRQVNGGAESECLQIAQHMSKYWDTEVLTTCALDYMDWKNELPEGVEQCDGTSIRRFRVDQPRDVARFNDLSASLSSRQLQVTPDEQEHWMRAQGPMSTPLLDFIKANQDEYDAFFFFGYLYATTYFGLQLVPDKAYLVPLAHDEWPIYFNMWDTFFTLPRGFVFNTEEELAFLRKRFPAIAFHGPIAGVGIDAPVQVDSIRFRAKYSIRDPYLLYAGRIDESKNSHELLDWFIQLREIESQPRKLVLIGAATLSIPYHPDVIHLGFVSEEEKWAALHGCDWLLNPSIYESLSIALLEGWAVGRAALVNGRCAVLVGHCARSNGGLWYNSFEEWVAAMTIVDIPTRAQLGRQGKNYVSAKYSWRRIEDTYAELLDQP